MSIPKATGNIPNEIDGTPVQIAESGARLPCPHEECHFQYWSLGDRQGKRIPTVQDKYSARDSPCEHFHDTWTPAHDTELAQTLDDAASASEIFCVIDKQASLEAEAQVVAVYLDRQTTLGGF